jgi:hypothetical protein
MKVIPTYQEIQKVRSQISHMLIKEWEVNTLFTWKWWFLVGLAIIPWFLFWWILDKKRIHEILLYGMLIGFFAGFLDNLGTDLLWWGYPIKMIPTVPPLITPDFTIVPCLMMLVYQYCQTWKSFLASNFILALLMAYVGEPFFIWLRLYELIEWKLIYSFLFYNISGIIARWIVLKTDKYKKH